MNSNKSMKKKPSKLEMAVGITFLSSIILGTIYLAGYTNGYAKLKKEIKQGGIVIFKEEEKAAIAPIKFIRNGGLESSHLHYFKLNNKHNNHTNEITIYGKEFKDYKK